MTDAQLAGFRNIFEQIAAQPRDWQWIGPNISQRMFGITEERAKAYQLRYGGEAKKMEK